MTTKTELRQQLDDAIKQYIEAFENKQDLNFEWAINDDLLECLAFGDYFFSIEQIVIDIDQDLPKGLILQWHNDRIKHEGRTINLRSYAMGLRYD
jgi:hypothetical protein